MIRGATFGSCTSIAGVREWLDKFEAGQRAAAQDMLDHTLMGIDPFRATWSTHVAGLTPNPEHRKERNPLAKRSERGNATALVKEHGGSDPERTFDAVIADVNALGKGDLPASFKDECLKRVMVETAEVKVAQKLQHIAEANKNQFGGVTGNSPMALAINRIVQLNKGDISILRTVAENCGHGGGKTGTNPLPDVHGYVYGMRAAIEKCSQNIALTQIAESGAEKYIKEVEKCLGTPLSKDNKTLITAGIESIGQAVGSPMP